MEDSVNNIGGSGSPTNEELGIASKEWNRVIDAAMKTGYREGIEDGSESVFQEGFDAGYKEAFDTAFTLGKYKSLEISMKENVEHPADIVAILDKTRRAACYICTKEAEGIDHSTSFHSKSLSEIISDQGVHTARIKRRLHEYFEPLMKKFDVDINQLDL